MPKNLQDTTTLHNGLKMPWLGLGVWKAPDDEKTVTAVKAALEIGYRSIDTATFYANEKSVGKGIKESNENRQNIFLTSKVWNDDQGYNRTLQAFEASLNKLGTDYLDLYLIHWPVKEKYIETWRAMEKLYKEGKVRAIGVCNFHQQHLEGLMANAEVKPMINQVEMHPHLTQFELRKYCKSQNIQLEAYSPLGHGRLTEDPALEKIGEKYGKTPAQVMLRWELQHKVVTIPKSVTPSRIKENANVFDFELNEKDMDAIDAKNRNERIGTNPDSFD